MICSMCKKDKPEEDFNWSKKGEKRQDRCRECCSEYNRQRYAANPKKFKSSVYRYQKENPNAYYLSRLRTAQRNPTKINAHRVVEAALACGVLEKPDTCSSCGCNGSVHRIEAHHEDYKKPLDVVWLCTPCHRKADAERRVREGLDAYPTCKKVAMMDVDGHVIKTFDSQKEAALFVSRAPNSISQAVKSGGMCAGYRWKSV